MLSEKGNILTILQNFIRNTIKAHSEEKESLMLLQNINTSDIPLSYEEVLSILGLFTNCQILQCLYTLYKENQQLPQKDYDYELNQKDREIEKQRQKIKELESKTKIDFQHITEKPKDFESDIFKACKEGKLASVQWLIEKENIDKNIRDKFHNTPIHIASLNGHLQIVQYLIDVQNVDKEIKGFHERTPLHHACKNGKFPIVEYLISKGANVEESEENGWTPLHFVSCYGKIDIIKYLISKGANKNAKNKSGKTPYDYCHDLEIKNLLK